MNYQDIMKVNSEMTMLDLKGKNYAMVPERVTAFRKLYPEGFIITQTVSNDGTTVMMQASVGYYKENGEAVTLATGFAQEVKGRGMVNGTSHIENCETSAVGRALGFLGIGIDQSIASAEEVATAIVNQDNDITEEEFNEIETLIKATGVSKDKLLEQYKLESFITIDRKRYKVLRDKLIKALREQIEMETVKK